MRDVAVVSFAQSPCVAANRQDDMAEILLPVIREAMAAAGIERGDIDFVASGSHDFFEGRTFAYIESLDAVGAWPPICESHVEMDGAWAFAEAWAWLQLGQGDIALVYGIGRGSLAQDLDQVMPAQLDPYFLAPLRPHPDAIAGLQACAMVQAGLTDERQLAEIVARSLASATGNPWAQTSGHSNVEDLMAAPYVCSPLRAHDISPPGDAAAVVVLAAGSTAAKLADRPAWVRGVDHRMDTHYPGMRDLTRSDSARIASERAAELAGFTAQIVVTGEQHATRTNRPPAWIHGMAWRTETGHFAGRDEVNPQAGRECAADAYRQAAIDDPLGQIDVAELYIPYSWYEPIWLENIGLAEPGEGWRLVEQDRTAFGGDIPVNPSGGVLSGNPTGATGLLRFAEAALQVRGLAGAHQVDGARLAVGHAMGGASQFHALWVVGSAKPGSTT